MISTDTFLCLEPPTTCGAFLVMVTDRRFDESVKRSIADMRMHWRKQRKAAKPKRAKAIAEN